MIRLDKRVRPKCMLLKIHVKSKDTNKLKIKGCSTNTSK